MKKSRNLLRLLRQHVVNGYADPVTNFNLPSLKRPICLFTHGGDEHVSKKMRAVEVWEPTETQCSMKLIRPNSLVVDVGANIGYYTVLFQHLVGASGTVIALEPDPNNYRLLKKNVRANGLRNARLIRAAASAEDGRGKLYHSDWNYGDHRLYPNADQSSGSSIKTVKLDRLIRQAGRAPDFVKIDCQGSEILIMAGLKSVIDDKLFRPRAMVVEFWPYGLSESGGSADQLLSFLDRPEYAMWDIGKWNDKPEPTDVRKLSALAKGPLAPETQFFTNIILVSVDEPALIGVMESMC